MSGDRPMGILQRSAGLVTLLSEQRTLSPAEIASQLDAPRSSVYRLSAALREAGLLESLPDSQIRLSLRWLHLADAARSGMEEWQHARPILDDLASSTGQTVFLSVPRGLSSICIDWAQGQAINVLALKPGRSLPLYAGAAGRVTLAHGLADPGAYLEAAPFTPYTDATLITAEALTADIAVSRRDGYTVSDADVTDGIGAIGAPLFWADGQRFAGALSVAGLAGDITARRAELVDKLLTSAQELTTTLAQTDI